MNVHIRKIGNRFNITESTSHDIITNYLLAMNDVAGKIIVRTTGEAALENIQKFPFQYSNPKQKPYFINEYYKFSIFKNYLF